MSLGRLGSFPLMESVGSDGDICDQQGLLWIPGRDALAAGLLPALCGDGARAGSLHRHIGHISLSTLEVTYILHKSFVYSKYRNWKLSWSCCGEAPAAGFAAGTGLGLATV